MEPDPTLKRNLEEMADINGRLVSDAPSTFREACQWILWYQMAARMYDGSGSLGRLDVLLEPFFEADVAAGAIDEDEAIFHIACLLLRDTAYLQVGGPNAAGDDVTSRVSFLVLEAAHALKIPVNVGVCVGDGVDPELLRRSCEIMLADKTGVPKFLGINQTAEGFARNGYPIELGRERAYSGCHWSAVPGREYTMNDMVKLNFAKVFEAAFAEMRADESVAPSVAELWDRFVNHLSHAAGVVAEGLDFHMAHMHKVFPDLVLSMLCYGPIEKGRDATNGGVEFYNLCVDGCALATVADSFAALEQRVEQEARYTWDDIAGLLAGNWDGPDGERARLLMHNIKRYGSGDSRADEYALRISQTFTDIVKAGPTPDGYNMIPGIFSWANTIPLGRSVGATPNGPRPGRRFRTAPIRTRASAKMARRLPWQSPSPACSRATATPAPMQIEMDPGIANEEAGRELAVQPDCGALRHGRHADQYECHGRGQRCWRRITTQQAPRPGGARDGVQRQDFANLSPEFRQLVVDRIIAETV